MLNTAAESYTRRMYSEFEEEFKRQFTLSYELLKAAGTNLTFFVKYMQSDREDSLTSMISEHFLMLYMKEF